MSSKSQLEAINEILNIDEVIATHYQTIDEIGCVIYLQKQESEVACPSCGKLTDKLHQNHWLTVRDLPLGEHNVYLKINRRQLKCKGCGKKFSEEFTFFKKRSHFTERLKSKIVEEVLSGDIKNVAQRNGLSEQEAITIIQEAGENLVSRKPENLTRLGIDEIAFIKGQKNYCAVLVDIDKKQVIAILPSRTQEQIRKCLESWGGEVLMNVKEVSIDLFSSYKSLANELMPNAEVVGDRFHVMKQVSEELDRERRKIKRESEKIKNTEEKKSKIAALTHSKYALLKNEMDLNELQKTKLGEIEKILPELSAMHKLKESFRKIFESKQNWADGLFELCAWCKNAQLKFPDSCGTIRRWMGEIISYFDNRTTQGVVEGINNKLKLIKRMGYGFRNFENFQIRSLLAWHFNH
jgi:transposase